MPCGMIVQFAKARIAAVLVERGSAKAVSFDPRGMTSAPCCLLLGKLHESRAESLISPFGRNEEHFDVQICVGNSAPQPTDGVDTDAL